MHNNLYELYPLYVKHDALAQALWQKLRQLLMQLASEPSSSLRRVIQAYFQTSADEIG